MNEFMRVMKPQRTFMQAFNAAEAEGMRRMREQPRFERTFCSQCGREFGPGDHGYSHCKNHRGAKMSLVKLLRYKANSTTVRDLPHVLRRAADAIEKLERENSWIPADRIKEFPELISNRMDLERGTLKQMLVNVEEIPLPMKAWYSESLKKWNIEGCLGDWKVTHFRLMPKKP